MQPEKDAIWVWKEIDFRVKQEAYMIVRAFLEKVDKEHVLAIAKIKMQY